MREQLIQYVNLLFAGNIGVEDIKQEILQNTLDRFDDLISQGKSEEAAYRLAITGIGDISEILGDADAPAPLFPATRIASDWANSEGPALNRMIRAIAIGLYIISLAPIIILDQFGFSEFGFIGTLTIVAVATVLLLIFKKENNAETPVRQAAPETPQNELKKSIHKLVDVIGLVIYLIISFATGAWFVTWLIFPLMAAINGIIRACMDLMEVTQNEI